jgi:hypothetical protein
MMYSHLKNKNLRICPKLTDKHIHPTNFQKMKVKLASQVFSHTVSASMELYVESNWLPRSALGTALFFQMINNLFDLFNSSHLQHANPYKRAYNNDKTQVTLLDNCVNTFKNLRMRTVSGDTDVTKLNKCFKGLLQSIEALKQLYKYFLSKQITGILTRRLNQDCLENFFGTIRHQSGNNVNPTPAQFKSAFKKLLLLHFFNHSDTFNCSEDDFSSIMLRVQDTNLLPPFIKDCNSSQQSILHDSNFNSNDADFQSKNCLKYICGYIFMKCLQKHSCQICVSYGKYQNSLDVNSKFCSLKTFETRDKTTFGNLQMPHQHFYNYICFLEDEFVKYFENTLLLNSEITRSLYNKIFPKIVYKSECPNFPLGYSLKLYLHMSVYYALKYYNRNINCPTFKNRKLLNVSHL